MTRPRLPWPVRSIVKGAAGTAAMTLAYELERRLRHGRRELDYDDSLVPGRIVASVPHLPAVSDGGPQSSAWRCGGARNGRRR